MTFLFSSKIILCFLGLFSFSFADSFNYPKNTSQLKFVEEISRTSSNSDRISDDERISIMLEKLETERKKLQVQKTKINTNSEELISLVDSYLMMSRPNVKDCNEERLSELTFMIHFHSNLKSSNEVLFYVQYFAWKQFKLCKVIWDREFYKTVSTKIDSYTREQSTWLLDDMVITKFKSKAPKRPYSFKTMSQLVDKPSPGGILLFLTRMGDILLDEDMKNSDYSWNNFLESLDFTLVPLCNEVCEKMKPLATLYQFMLNPELNRKQEVQEMYETTGACFPEWMAKTQICCQIARDREKTEDFKDNLLKNAFDEM